ncbi:hypothetical protein [Candidatus Magnetomonas plexicatena]|uniref:hypothetical protein n=1 Tax=Candidatus Magnetomonas plexicatena TaxID=2552947 RepID=UPI001101340E|nr:hypothetical protein E2O03_001415 [Nitrospirales bacterium LBB_01]
MKPLSIIKLLICVIAAFVLFSCAQYTPVTEHYEKITFDEFISRLKAIREIKGTADISMQAKDVYMSGMASMKLSPNEYEVKLFALGIPVGEFRERNGVFYSRPKLKPEEEQLISLCIKNGIFWWMNNVNNVTTDSKYLKIKQPRQQMVLDRESLMPIEQFIFLSQGSTLHIAYGDVKWLSGIWYPNRITATLGSYKFTINTEDVKFEKY